MTDPHSHRAPEGRPPWHVRIRRALRERRSSAGTHGLGWRLLTPTVFVLAGGLFVASAISSGGTDLRPGRYDDLADLAAHRSDEVASLNRQRARIQAEVDELSKGLGGSDLAEMTAKVDALRGPAGLLPVHGPGLTVTLDDAPAPPLGGEDDNVKAELVHQQDIQAVVNALWAGGAEAVTVQGHRITSTTGIKCVGNSVLLQGVAYPPPYVISGIGDMDALRARLDEDPVIQRYLRDVDIYGLTWDVELESDLTFPAYEGSTETRYARPITPPEDDGA